MGPAPEVRGVTLDLNMVEEKYPVFQKGPVCGKPRLQVGNFTPSARDVGTERPRVVVRGIVKSHAVCARARARDQPPVGPWARVADPRNTSLAIPCLRDPTRWHAFRQGSSPEVLILRGASRGPSGGLLQAQSLAHPQQGCVSGATTDCPWHCAS